MLAKFSIIGFLGKVTIPEKFKGKEVVFLSMVTSNVYNGVYYTQWINNISLWGKRSRFVSERGKPGQLWYLEGDLKVMKTKRGEKVMFNVSTFRMLRENQDEQIEKLQKRELENFQKEIHAYDEFEDDEIFDDLEYERIKKEKGSKPSISEK